MSPTHHAQQQQQHSSTIKKEALEALQLQQQHHQHVHGAAAAALRNPNNLRVIVTQSQVLQNGRVAADDQVIYNWYCTVALTFYETSGAP